MEINDQHPSSANIWVTFASSASGANAVTAVKAAEWADAMLLQFVARHSWSNGYGWRQRPPAQSHL